MKTLLHSRNAALPIGSSENLHKVPSSVLPGSVIALGIARRLPLDETRRGSHAGHADFWHHRGVRTPAARAA